MPGLKVSSKVMKLFATNTLAFLVAILGLALFAAPVQANAPDVKGRVVFRDTGEPMPGVVIRWVDDNDNEGDEDGVRYTRTDADGWYYFPSFNGSVNRPSGAYESSTRIDTDGDGTEDAPVWKVYELYSSGHAKGFGCGQNPHTFTALQPASPPGYFENDGLITADLEEGEIDNGESEEILPTIHFVRTTPNCPPNLSYSCDASGNSATVSWSVPVGGATGYKLHYLNEPYLGEGTLHSNQTNQLSRTFNVISGLNYIARVRTLHNGQESEACTVQFSCQCTGSGCGAGGGIATPPAADLVSCINNTDPYYRYTVANIDTYGLPFINSRLMLTFSYNATTQRIMDFINNQTNSTTADFSRWQEQGRTRQDGDYLGYYIHTFDTLSGNSLTYQIEANTRIGTRSMAEFRQFLINEGLSTQVAMQANMSTRNGENGVLFNPHIPAPARLDLSKEFSDACSTAPAPGGCPLITITQPAPGQVLTPVNNRITVSWSAPGAIPSTQFEVMIYDRAAYTSADEAYQAYLVGLAVPVAMPDNLIVYNTVNRSQVVNFGDINGLDPANWMMAVKSVGTTILGESCPWEVPNPPPLPPGFTASGKVYQYNPQCEPLVEVPISGTIAVSPSGQSIPVTGGSYTTSLPQTGSSYAFQLTLDDETYDCANICGQGPSCVRDNITETNPNADYFVRDDDVFTRSWWHVYGGFAFAQNIMNSQLPITNDNQSWRLMNPLVSGVAETAGIPLTNRDRFGNDAPDNTNVAGWLREPPLQVASAGISNVVRPDFAYFRDKLSLPTSRLPEVITQVSQLNGQNRNGVVVHYREGDLRFMPDTTWSIGSNQHHVVLVQGNITISAERLSGTDSLVSTSSNSTTAFVASGTITITGSVGNSVIDSFSPNLDGIFIGNQLVIQDDGNSSIEDKPFVGRGNFIGWSNVLLQRQFDDINLNSDYATETFIARPDFVVNLPEVLRDTSITWQETN